jgi:DNA-binding CsgD family transcriptional regulator
VIENKNSITIFIASNVYFIRSGIRGIIHDLGIDANFVSLNSLDELNNHRHSSSDFLIIHNKLLQKPKANHLNEISVIFKGKILGIGELAEKMNFFDNYITLSTSKIAINQQMQAFLQVKPKSKIPNNNMLSSRETDILKEVAMGYSNKEIAERLFISINTVITHRKNITEKLGIKTISGLTVYALLNQLILPENVST